MPAITATSMNAAVPVAVTETTLNGTTDSLVYNEGRRALLILRNPTAGALSPVIDGDGATSVGVPGVGTVSLSSGFEVGSIAAGGVRCIPLDQIKHYLAGTIAVTGGTGLVAQILEF